MSRASRVRGIRIRGQTRDKGKNKILTPACRPGRDEFYDHTAAYMYYCTVSMAYGIRNLIRNRMVFLFTRDAM